MRNQLKTAAALALALTCYPIDKSASAQKPAANNKKQAEKIEPDPTLNAIKEGIEGIWRALETQNAQADAEGKTDYAEANLKAQAEMAKWAYYQMWISLGALIISAVALRFLYVSLKQTRDAIKDNREIGEAQVRGYLALNLRMVTFKGIHPETKPNVVGSIENTGQSQVTDIDVTFIAQIRRMDTKEPIGSPITARTFIGLLGQRVCENNLRLHLRDFELSDEQAGAAIAAATDITATVTMSYVDIFQKRQTTPEVVYWGRPRKDENGLFVCEIQPDPGGFHRDAA